MVDRSEDDEPPANDANLELSSKLDLGFPLLNGNFALSDRDDEPAETSGVMNMAQKTEPEAATEPTWYGNEDSSNNKKGPSKELTKEERAEL